MLSKQNNGVDLIWFYGTLNMNETNFWVKFGFQFFYLLLFLFHLFGHTSVCLCYYYNFYSTLLWGYEVLIVITKLLLYFNYAFNLSFKYSFVALNAYVYESTCKCVFINVWGIFN